MKKTLIVALLFILFTSKAWAHGGFEKEAENTVVYINQIPVSPLVGEKVDFTFQFRDPTVPKSTDLSTQNLSNIPVKITLVDTFYGDESKDKVVFSKEFKTDVNGNISFSYKFPKENYYDIEFSYKDHKGIAQETGYLIQPRELNDSNDKLPVVILIFGFLLVCWALLKVKK